ncbi:MAG: OmpA family protein [Flavobacteriales bacterium]|nr:OmpA family protein [Flavobacteriales bacterium]
MKSAVIPFLLLIFSTTSCVSMQKYTMLENDRAKCEDEFATCERQRLTLESKVTNLEDKLSLREEQIIDLKDQVADAKSQRDTQIGQVEGLTELSQTANKNIGETLAQLEKKDKYIYLLQAAKSRTDSINLALAVNLKKVLKDGIEDEDVEVRVDKTVVFINLSDKMLFQSGSSTITSRANEVLEKIATIIESRPNFEVMVEGYTDSIPISTECVADNWELSAKRATSVVKALQIEHGVDPNRLIAAGRGEFNALESNATPEGRAINRRTRIVIMPELDQFYDLLDPSKAPQE